MAQSFYYKWRQADLVQVVATTDKSQGTKGMSIFAVETKTKDLM
jgi:alkylation response protein AidB-like acyl-CoA dehydrogenase